MVGKTCLDLVEQSGVLKILIFNLGMVPDMNAVWLLMASDGQFRAEGAEVAGKILKLNTLAMGRQALHRISWKLEGWT